MPAFLGFVAAGVLLGVTLSFLIASPLVNEVAVVLLYGLVGVRIAARYVASGRLIAIVAGFILGRLRPERLASIRGRAGIGGLVLGAVTRKVPTGLGKSGLSKS